MIILKKNLTVKKYLVILFLSLSVITFDYFTKSSETESTYLDTFLGTGIKETKGPCNDAGFRVVTHQVKILYMNVGDSWTTEEACDAGAGIGNPNLNG